MSEVPPLTSDSETESENCNATIVTSPVTKSWDDSNKNSSSNCGAREDNICDMQEAKPNDLNDISLMRQNSDSLSDLSADNDEDDDNGDDHEDADDDEYESDEGLSKTGDPYQLPEVTATQYPQMETTISSSPNKPKKPLLSGEDKLQLCLQQATLSYFDKNYLSAASEYKIALTMAADKRMKYKSIETWIIKYCLGRSLINLTLVKEIHDGEKVFQSLIDEDKPTISILGYLGLAKAYLKQNRFVDAIGPLQEGLRLIGEGFSPPTCHHWPGTLIDIEETNDSPGLLKDLFDTLLSECRNPPLPLAVCRYSNCLDPFKTQIYPTDPEFKGFTQVSCFEKCLIEFHRDCWRELKATQLDKRSDKELVNRPCMTPDCNSAVCKISIIGSDGNVLKTMTIDDGPSKLKRPGQKHRTVSVQQGKSVYQKKVGMKRSKGGVGEEKARADDIPVSVENRNRSVEINHGRDDFRPVDLKMVDGGARGPKIAHRRKSLESNGAEDQEQTPHSLKKKGLDPAVTDIDHLVTMQRTDFVALQRKRNEEQGLDCLSKKPKKKRDKERQKKTLHLDEFVEKVETDDGDHVDDLFSEVNHYGNQLWEIPHFMSLDCHEQDWMRSSSATQTYSDYHTSEAAVSNGNIWSVSSADVMTEKAAGDASVAKNPAEKFTIDAESVLTTKNNADDATVSREMPLETTEDIKGNILLYFEVLLEKLGPCLPDEESIHRELEAFSLDAQVMVSEAGGIAKLLLQSLKFSQVDGYICLLKDAAKARQKARQRRVELIEGRNFVKRFGQLIGRPSPPVTAAEKDTCSAFTVSTSSVSVPAVSSTVNSKENKTSVAMTSSTSVAMTSSTSVAMTSSTSVAMTSSTSERLSCRTDRKAGEDGLFGLCDLNEYKEMLRAKSTASQAARFPSKGKAADDDSSLSVIEKFKKEVHKAACKEKTVAKEKKKSMQPALIPITSTQAPISVNAGVPAYSKSLFTSPGKSILGGKTAGNGAVNSAAAATAFSCKDAKTENGNNVKTTTAYLFDIFRNPPEDMLSSLLDIVDDEDLERKPVTGKTIADLDDFDLIPTGIAPKVIFPRNDSFSESSSAVKSTLSVTASEFHFPKFTSSFKSNSILTQSTVPTSSSDLAGNYAAYEPRLSPYNYSLSSSPTVTSYNCGLPEIHRLRGIPSSPNPDFMGVVNADRGFDYEHKSTNTDQMSFSLDEYDYLKRERDDLIRRCNGHAEKHRQVKNEHIQEMSILREKLENTEKKFEALKNESLHWRSEKMMHEEEIEKLRSDLAFTKSSLQSAKHLVDVTDRLLSETQNALKSEQDQCVSLREKYENLLCQLERNLRGNTYKSENLKVPPVSNAAVTTVDHSSKTLKKTKHSFDKIIHALSAMFPNLSKIELSRRVQDFRERRNNSLSGLTVHEIVACVRDLVLRERAAKKNVQDLACNVPHSGKHNTGTNGTAYGEEVFQEEVDPCIICHEELCKESASMLDCGHSFHTECVRKWFREQSTCPTCRNHALLPDEFPTLGGPLFH